MFFHLRFFANQEITHDCAAPWIAAHNLIETDGPRDRLFENQKLQSRQSAQILIQIGLQYSAGSGLCSAAPGGPIRVPIEDQVRIEDAFFIRVLIDRFDNIGLIEVLPRLKEKIDKVARGEPQQFR